MSHKDAYTLFSYQETRITAEPSALGAPIFIFFLGAILARGVSLGVRLRRGIFASLAYITTDITHFGGHIYSSRYANAPLNQVHLGAPMPVSVYDNNDVSPQAHKMRAIGGPIASGISLLVSLLLRSLTRPNTAMRDFFTAQCWMHAIFGFGSLAPIPFVDGGSILKWTMVERGQTPEQADENVKEANIVLGGLIGGVGLVSLLFKKWWLALGCLVMAAQFVAIGLGKLKIK
ncbi:MAG: hypothetical protein KDI02_21570 [Anaerolineae bacterium]|nr:hypothetical protein [Anaerolineae bacterium]